MYEYKKVKISLESDECKSESVHKHHAWLRLNATAVVLKSHNDDDLEKNPTVKPDKTVRSSAWFVWAPEKRPLDPLQNTLKALIVQAIFLYATKV